MSPDVHRTSDSRERAATSGWALAIAIATVMPHWEPDPGAGLQPAGFWIRVLATLIDAVLVSVTALFAVVPIGIAVGSVTHGTTGSHRVEHAILVSLAVATYALCFWLYYALHEASTHRGTPGKQILHLQVQDELGPQLTFWRASLRYWVKYVIGPWTFGVGFAMAAFQPRKQGLHDQICGTVVIRSHAHHQTFELRPVGVQTTPR